MIKKISKNSLSKIKKILFADPELLKKEDENCISDSFFFEGTNRKGVLLVHGWTSTPYEVRRLGKYLNENGYTVLGVLLAGHGTSPEDLEDVGWQQWVNDVRSGHEKLLETCDKVYVGGTSIGANLAMILAKEKKNIAAIVLMAAPCKMRLEKLGLFSLRMLMLFKKKYRKKFYPPTFGLSTTITRIISYQRYPVKNLLEVYETVKAARSNLSEITQPCFVLQSTHDHIIAKDSMECIYAGISSEIKKKKYIEKAYHTFISDIKNEYVFESILEFLDEN